MGVPPSRKVTVPVGPSPPLTVLTLAVKVIPMPEPGVALFAVTTVVVGAWVTVMFFVGEVLGLKPEGLPD